MVWDSGQAHITMKNKEAHGLGKAKLTQENTLGLCQAQKTCNNKSNMGNGPFSMADFNGSRLSREKKKDRIQSSFFSKAGSIGLHYRDQITIGEITQQKRFIMGETSIKGGSFSGQGRTCSAPARLDKIFNGPIDISRLGLAEQGNNSKSDFVKEAGPFNGIGLGVIEKKGLGFNTSENHQSVQAAGLGDTMGLGLVEMEVQGLVQSGKIQRAADDNMGYYSEVEIRTNEILAKRADSAPAYSTKNKNSTTKFLKRVKPKLKEKFCSGKVIKWNDFCGQKLRKKEGKLALSVEDLREESEFFWTKPTLLNVYSRKNTRKKGGGKLIKSNCDALLNDEDALLDGGENSEGEVGIQGFSSSDDGNSSEEFNITSDYEDEAEKELQEEAAFEGFRSLMGEGGQFLGGEVEEKEDQVQNQMNNNGTTLNLSCDNIGRLLNSLNISLITADKGKGCDNREIDPSINKRSGARELRNLVFNVNYEKCWREQGNKYPQ